jgi:isoleucyl-tRNA synthetase
MPYAQFHYPFEEEVRSKGSSLPPLGIPRGASLPPLGGPRGAFPADFIAEGVDQTRGWFYTLHVIAAMVFDNVAFKNCVSNGLVLDKNGNKMSKRMGNAVDPFETIEKFGPDALRWYMITNAQPWDNLKFDINGVDEVRRKFFGTLYNTYSFFALYANIDNFRYQEPDFPIEQRPEIDRWILSELNTLISYVDKSYEDYEPKQAGRAIFDFVNDYLSNWYVRLCRRRFWHGEYTEDKISAYQTLYTCLETVAQLASPIAPFYADCLFRDLNNVTQRQNAESVHLTKMPVANETLIDKELETRMQLAQKICSLTLSLRKKNNIRVRQPLEKIMIPVSGTEQRAQIEAVEHLILSEVNLKSIEYLTESSNKLVKKIKPNFKILGPKYGQMMKSIAEVVAAMEQHAIAELERHNEFLITVDNQPITLTLEDVEITTEDIPGWVVASEGFLTVALDVVITEPLYQEGIARDMVNRIQNLRKEAGLEVTDRIRLMVEKREEIFDAVNNNIAYICRETLMDELVWQDKLQGADIHTVDISDDIMVMMKIEKNKLL